MATNAISPNPTAEPTSSVSPLQPPLLSETSSTVRNYDDKDPVGDTVRGKAIQGNSVGQLVIGEAGKEKTAKEVEKERRKAEKLTKFNEKQLRPQASPAAASQAKQKKVKNPTAVDAYEPKKVEGNRYEWWESRGFFKPQFTNDGEVKPRESLSYPSHHQM